MGALHLSSNKQYKDYYTKQFMTVDKNNCHKLKTIRVINEHNAAIVNYSLLNFQYFKFLIRIVKSSYFHVKI